MKSIWKRGGRGVTICAAALALLGTTASAVAKAPQAGRFGRDASRLTNPYLPISKFRRCVLTGYDTGEHLRVVRVLKPGTRTFTVEGRAVKAAIVDDQVTDVGSGEVIEHTIDYFAQDRAGNAYYFGEDVTELSNGEVSGHGGSWLVGRHGAEPGMLMPAHPKVGQSFYSEKVPGVAVELDTVVASGLHKVVDGHRYGRVIRVKEHATTPKPAEFELKTYAPGTGVISEANGELHLVGCS